jgi:transcriptional regulator with XRE-family HTH domain
MEDGAVARPDVFPTLKAALRARGVTYRDLAAHLGMSESGVKKMLTAKDFPLGRLLEICEWLGVSAAEMVKLVERPEIREVELSAAQQDALVKDPVLFRVYWRLSVENETPERIRDAEGLAAVELRRRLARLERLDLVTSAPSGRVRPRHQGLFRWAQGNPLVDRLNRDWSRTTLDAALAAATRDDGMQRLSYLRLAPETLADLLRALGATVDEFARRAKREELTRRPADLRPFRLLVAGATGRFVDAPPARAIAVGRTRGRPDPRAALVRREHS